MSDLPPGRLNLDSPAFEEAALAFRAAERSRNEKKLAEAWAKLSALHEPRQPSAFGARRDGMGNVRPIATSPWNEEWRTTRRQKNGRTQR